MKTIKKESSIEYCSNCRSAGPAHHQSEFLYDGLCLPLAQSKYYYAITKDSYLCRDGKIRALACNEEDHEIDLSKPYVAYYLSKEDFFKCQNILLFALRGAL